ncbi:MAG: hypothetical protein ABJB09_01975 [Verrucomicrobiota bacterium]
MFDELHVYHDAEPKSGALNMAVDEALLLTTSCPTLRLYHWLGRALSFGYFGRYAEVAGQQRDHDIVRRWTGGGIVPHGDDLTYSIIIPSAAPTCARSSLQIYSDVHEAIRAALVANQIDAALANSAAPKISNACFANAVRHDVICAGEKIAGAAHRRSRAGLLHQGSIQLEKLPARFVHDFASRLCPGFEGRDLSPPLIDRAHALAQSKYGTVEWLTRR